MGRKIPGRKHRGTKDPNKQGRERYNRIKDKINLAPSNPDIQETPHSINRLARVKEELKISKGRLIPNKQKRKRNTTFEQKKGESKKQFLYRVHKACDAVIKENAFENKYGVQIKRNSQTGQVEGLVKKPKNEIDKLMNKMRKKKLVKGKLKLEAEEPTLTKSQKRRKKLQEKKHQKLLQNVSLEPDVDNIQFGEVAHAPPTLTVPRKVSKVTTAPRPGQKDLLLTSLISKNDMSVTETKHKSNTVINKVIDKTGKRKDLPNALRRKLDQQQTEIIKAYRLLKKQKYV